MKFVADPNLGKLAKWLRVLGFDTTYYRSADKLGLIQLAQSEERLILTRDRWIRQKAESQRDLKCCFIHDDRLADQLDQIIKMVEMAGSAETQTGERGSPIWKPFSRCIECNLELNDLSKESVEGKVPDFVFSRNQRFSQCPRCGKIFWNGTHSKDMMERIRTRLDELETQH